MLTAVFAIAAGISAVDVAVGTTVDVAVDVCIVAILVFYAVMQFF